MSKEVVQGVATYLIGNVWDLGVTPPKPKTSGTIYAVVRLDKPGDADNGKFWDTNAGGSWQASPTTWPTATYLKGSVWGYLVPTGATSGKQGGRAVLDDLTDNIATPASSTVMAGGMESADIVTALHAQTDSTIAAVTAVDHVTGAVGSVTAGVTLAADQAVNATKWAGQAIPAPSVTGVPRVDARYLVGADLSGNNADLKLRSQSTINPSGDAILAQSTGGNGSGLHTIGNGTGPGTYEEGGASGPGAATLAKGSNRAGIEHRSNAGPGISSTGADGYDGAVLQGVGIGSGIVTVAGAGGNGWRSQAYGGHAAIDVSAGGILGNITGSLSGAVGSVASFGTLVVDMAAAVWSYVTRTLTGSTGSRQITVRVATSGGTRVPSVEVSVFDATNTAFVTGGTTNASGELVVALNDGTYSLRCSRPGYSFTVPETVVVTADAVAPIVATAWAPPLPADPGDCTVWDWLEDLNGPLAGAKIRFRVHVPGPCGAGTGLNTWTEVTADVDGLFSLDIPQGTQVEIDCRAAGYVNKVKTVPAAASQQLRTWV